MESNTFVGKNSQRLNKSQGTSLNSSIQIRPPQVRIQLPLVESSTQTDHPANSEKLWLGPYVNKSGTDSSTFHSQDDHSPESFIELNYQSGDNSMETMTSNTPGSSETWNNAAISENKFSSAGKKSVFSSYLIALRPWSFTASITPVALGSCLAYKSQGVFDIYIFFTTICTALCVHAAGNLVNTYFDFIRGIDNKKSDDRTLVDNILSPNDVVTLGAILYIVGCSGFMLLNFLSPAKLEHLALIYFCGLSSSFLYTGGLGLKYIAMGDILIVLTFGPLTVVFSHLSQTGQLSLVPLTYAVPLALSTEAILHSNNTRDMESDRQAGMITMAILLGKTGSYCLFCFLLFAPYLLFVTVGVHYCPWMLLPAATIFFVFSLEKNFRRGNLLKMPQQVAQLNLSMGVLYIIALYFSDPNTLPSMTPFAS